MNDLDHTMKELFDASIKVSGMFDLSFIENQETRRKCLSVIRHTLTTHLAPALISPVEVSMHVLKHYATESLSWSKKEYMQALLSMSDVDLKVSSALRITGASQAKQEIWDSKTATQEDVVECLYNHMYRKYFHGVLSGLGILTAKNNTHFFYLRKVEDLIKNNEWVPKEEVPKNFFGTLLSKKEKDANWKDLRQSKENDLDHTLFSLIKKNPGFGDYFSRLIASDDPHKNKLAEKWYAYLKKSSQDDERLYLADHLAENCMEDGVSLKSMSNSLTRVST